jgi:hypothetical protein
VSDDEGVESYTKWPKPDPKDTYNGKCVLQFNHEMVFAELAILRIFQQTGWDGRWIDSYGRKYRIGYWGEVEGATQELPLEEPSIPQWETIRTRANCKGGCFDVFCWRDGAVIFAEAKRKGKDRVRATQRRWLEASLDAAIPFGFVFDGGMAAA